MTSLLYALNIGTLATWLTVAGASTVACVVLVEDRLPELKVESDQVAEVFITPQAMGSAPPAEAPDLGPEEAPAEDFVAAELPESPAEFPELPELPELPDLAEVEPLPDVPDFPVPAPAAPRVETRPKATSRSSPQQPRATTGTQGRRSSSGDVGRGTGQGSGTAQGSGSGATGSDRWIGLRKSSPNYPSSARRQGHQGRVIVQFTVDERGYVVDAKITSPSPYSALNEEALRTVRRFRAKPGVRATTSQPIIFKLN
jgi:protein TonB